MALDYRKCAQEIADNIGGGSNVASAAHCATRLRLVISDNSKVNKEALENVDGVKGMFESNGQLQLIIGTGTVNKVYDEFLDITGVSAASKEEAKAAAAAKQPWYIRLLKPIGDVFVPILPAIVASGLMMGLVAAFLKIGASAYGVTGIPGYLTINNPLLYTIVLAISGGIAFAITTVIFKEDEPKKKAAPAAPAVDMASQPVVIEVGADKIVSPAVGTLVKQENIPDETFASGVLGAGLGIAPTKGVVVAPCDGTISTVAESKHAIGISTDTGLELLIHVGVDTVKMNGDGFSPAVAEGDTVKKGDLLLNFDIDKIKKAGYSDTVVFLLTNSDDFNEVKVNA